MARRFSYWFYLVVVSCDALTVAVLRLTLEVNSRVQTLFSSECNAHEVHNLLIHTNVIKRTTLKKLPVQMSISLWPRQPIYFASFRSFS